MRVGTKGLLNTQSAYYLLLSPYSLLFSTRLRGALPAGQMLRKAHLFAD